MSERDRGEILWSPPSDAGQATRVGRFAAAHGHANWDSLLVWSVSDLSGFWSAVAAEFDVPWMVAPNGAALAEAAMPGAVWFPGAELNYAQVALRRAAEAPDEVALVCRAQVADGDRTLTWAELEREVARCRAMLVARGVGRGDRVVAYVPNTAHAIIGFLATASLGAIWASCPPEFGTRAVIDRFAQLDPVFLFAVDGYRYGTKDIDKRADAVQIVDALPTLKSVVRIRHLGTGPDEFGPALAEADPAPGGALAFTSVPFDHPLYVLFSSGTTGLPKAIVHGHGGVVLEHLKSIGLHHDLGPGDRFFWFSTTGWMMWNYAVSGLLVGASVVVFDGDPMFPGDDALWRIADETGCTMFGASAGYLLHCRKAGVRPARGKLRSVGSTGAPLPADGFRWVYEQLGRGEGDELVLASISGGTDVCTAFVGMSPMVPVRAGEIATRCLGIAAEAFDPDGRACPPGTTGELVITQPMPSMPVGFWGDASGERLEAAYFADFPGVWRHGDWVEFADDGACIVSGRSDATLNRGGVRLGSGDFYAVVEALPEVADSLVVHLDREDDPAGRLVLFVVAPDVSDDDALARRIAGELRGQLSPRHVPDRLVRVAQIPRTLSGKKLEVPVKRVLQGAAPSAVASRDSLVDPSALDAFVALRAELTGEGRA